MENYVVFFFAYLRDAFPAVINSEVLHGFHPNQITMAASVLAMPLWYSPSG